MINTYTNKNVSWIDVESPTKTDVQEIMDKYHVDPLVAQAILTPSIKPKIEVYDSFVYFILNFPIYKRGRTDQVPQEVDFILGKKFIVTARYDVVDPLHKFARAFEVNTILDKGNMGEHAGFVLFYMLKKLYESLRNELDTLEDYIKAAESKIFQGQEKEMVFSLSKISRALLDFKQGIAHHREILNSLDKPLLALFGPEFKEYSDALKDEYDEIEDLLQNRMDLLSELRSTNDSLLSTKQNETIRIFTVLAFLTFPPTVVVDILTLNSPSNPFRDMPSLFWLVVSVMIAIVLGLYGVFKYKKWL
jgi:magnesium transporter